MAKFTISLDKIIDEFKLETIYTPKNASEIEKIGRASCRERV